MLQFVGFGAASSQIVRAASSAAAPLAAWVDSKSSSMLQMEDDHLEYKEAAQSGAPQSGEVGGAQRGRSQTPRSQSQEPSRTSGGTNVWNPTDPRVVEQTRQLLAFYASQVATQPTQSTHEPEPRTSGHTDTKQQQQQAQAPLDFEDPVFLQKQQEMYRRIQQQQQQQALQESRRQQYLEKQRQQQAHAAQLRQRQYERERAESASAQRSTSTTVTTQK